MRLVLSKAIAPSIVGFVGLGGELRGEMAKTDHRMRSLGQRGEVRTTAIRRPQERKALKV